MNSKITAVGHYEPARIVGNNEIATIYQEKGWINKGEENGIIQKAEKSGFHERRRCTESEDTRTMATMAVKNLVERYGESLLENLDAIYMGTLTPPYLFPSISSLVAKDIEDLYTIKFKGYAIDILNACPSALNAMISANQAIQSGNIKKALIIGSDKLTSMIDGFSKDSLLLFGDAAGAIILESVESNHFGIESNHTGIQGHISRTYPQEFSDVYYKTDLGSTDETQKNAFIMDGSKVYIHGVRYVTELIGEYLESKKLSLDQFSYIIPHQANKRMLDQIASNLNFPAEKVLKTLHENGNTAAASPFLTLSKNIQNISPGERVLLLSLGAGFNVTIVDTFL